MTIGRADTLLTELPPAPTDAAPRRARRPASATARSTLHFRIGRIEVELRSDMPEVAEDIAALYRGWTSAEPFGGPSIRMEIKASDRARWRPTRYAIVGDGQELFSGLKPEEVLPYLEWGVNYRVLATRPEYFQLHAATLAYEGNGVMLVGQSGSGKSTLAAALAARGWGYLCDEFALIHRDTLHLHPFPKALCVKAGSFDLIRRLGLPLWRRRLYVKAIKGKVGYVSPHDVRAETGSFPVRLIVFPRYTGDDQTTLSPVSRAHAAYFLAANAFNRHLLGERLVSVLGQLVCSAQCVSVRSGGLEETGQMLETLARKLDAPA